MLDRETGCFKSQSNLMGRDNNIGLPVEVLPQTKEDKL